LRDFMAGVFEFWCREGVDGFRCDAGYMIPADVWTYIVARVRASFPDTVFLLEGLGGKISVTRQLLDRANLDWAYSEVFQTEDRSAFEQYFPGAMALSAEVGPLIHFAETHDNVRLAARSQTYARLRVALAAMLSDQGAFGITNGVEWFATERVDVHGASALRWGGEPNQCAELRRLNTLLETHPAFGRDTAVRLVQERDGNTLAILRTPPDASRTLLALANLDPDHAQAVHWPVHLFDPVFDTPDLLGAHVPLPERFDGLCRLMLDPGQVLCLARQRADAAALAEAVASPTPRTPAAIHRQELRAAALRVRGVLRPDAALGRDEDADAIAADFERDPLAFIERLAGPSGLPPVSVWRWPQDARRVMPIPPGHVLLVEAPSAFHARLEDRHGATLDRCRSIALPSGLHLGLFEPLPASVANTRFGLRLCVFEPAGPCRWAVDVLALRRDGRPQIRTAFTGPEVRGGNLVALLANGRGAMAHVPARWPELRSRYDALLAANPDPHVPCDRQVLFSRCRLWLRHRGYSQSVDATCLERFASTAGTGEALWEFRVPVGLGRWTPLSVRLRLEQGVNRVQLTVTRPPAPHGDGETLPDSETVRVILRPDIESRSFHDTTKAYSGPEDGWRAASHPEAHGVAFRPEGRPGLVLRSDRCVYAHEPEWQYMVGRPLEAERGLDATSDLFSPGYFHQQLHGGESIRLTAAMDPDPLPPPAAESDAAPRSFGDRIALGTALPLALQDFVVRRDDLLTVIAGYPWFLDWGRDTFIVLRGMIAAGMTDAALGILREFGRFERAGTLPNMIRGNDDSNRDTSDAPLWYAVAARDLARTLGRRAVLDADCGGRTLSDVLVSLATGYRHGTPNGIRVDVASGLVFSPAHYTWMDTNFPAATPREGYPVEIQALWIATLSFLAEVFPDGEWRQLAAQAKTSLRQLFWREEDGFLSDCLHAPSGVPAASATPDDHLRCNQLFAVTLGAIDDKALGRRILRACETLLVPGAIRTLADRPVTVPLAVWRDGQCLNDPHRPYWGRYEGDEDTRRKPAYHNGTAWTWPFPSYAEALVAVYGRSARPAAVALLESCIELFDDGVVGHLPEIVDGDAPHAQRGCYAQAWSVSEVLRVATLLG
jgi:predicted glycogen debranching enzyme